MTDIVYRVNEANIMPGDVFVFYVGNERTRVVRQVVGVDGRGVQLTGSRNPYTIAQLRARCASGAAKYVKRFGQPARPAGGE